jgi:hypothetical protein
MEYLMAMNESIRYANLSKEVDDVAERMRQAMYYGNGDIHSSEEEYGISKGRTEVEDCIRQQNSRTFARVLKKYYGKNIDDLTPDIMQEICKSFSFFYPGTEWERHSFNPFQIKVVFNDVFGNSLIHDREDPEDYCSTPSLSCGSDYGNHAWHEYKCRTMDNLVSQTEKLCNKMEYIDSKNTPLKSILKEYGLDYEDFNGEDLETIKIADNIKMRLGCDNFGNMPTEALTKFQSYLQLYKNLGTGPKIFFWMFVATGLGMLKFLIFLFF